MKEKNFKRIIIICGALILILVLVLVIIIISIVSDTGESDALGTTNNYLDTDKVIPMSAEEFFQEYYEYYEYDVDDTEEGYAEKVSEEDVYMAITKLAKYIIDNKEDIDGWTSNEMYDIYSGNEEEFKSMGIVDEDSFVDIMKKVQEIEEDDLALSYTAFDIDTISKSSDKFEVEFTIKYTGVDALIFILELSTDASSENPIQIYLN